jgi:Helix-turn-helix domain
MKTKRPARRLPTQEARAWAAEVWAGDPLAKGVLLALTHYVNGESTCFVSIDQLARDTELHPDTVRRRLAVLEQIGAISRTAQWVENGLRNAENRGKRTTDLITLRVDVDPSSIKPRAKSSDGTVVIAPSHEQTDGENSDVRLGTQSGIDHDQKPAPALVQPSHYSKGLISEHEHERSPPAPPPGGSFEFDFGWWKFAAAWPEPILKLSLARELWRNLTERERAVAIVAARGYTIWNRTQRTPARYSAQSFLRERDGWAQFAALASRSTSSVRQVFEAEGSMAWLARVVIAKIIGASAPIALDLPEGRGRRFNQPPEEYLQLAKFAEQDATVWQFVCAGAPECDAWCKFLKIEPRSIVVATTIKVVNGQEYANWPVKEYGLRVPLLFPPAPKPFSAQKAEQQPQVSSTHPEIEPRKTEEH